MTPNPKISDRRYLLIVRVVVGLLLLWLMVRPGPDQSTVPAEVKQTKQEQASLKQKDEQAHQVIGGLMAENDSLQKRASSLQKELDNFKKEAAVSKEKTRRLTAELDRAKQDRDTAAYINTCDSLKLLAEEKDFTISRTQASADSLDHVRKEQLALKDTIISIQQSLLADFRSANTSLEEKYYAAAAENTKLTKKVKRERNLGRVLAGGLLIIGGLLISK
ncbi:hypothetical protein [Paraflavitalea sp. CAU 1676]|uniref:hypothetical protein n=1 Tax=Paraflavitalea sp. CAU 1676 TaxID=3032598 RepID=UPI0023DBF825|nr:hypothetical protein [Paraflavitalea sp. CAU 1676]MDF2189272.1 hypothetical protein [Paraflavitalea sp. CAU 1676]